MPTSPGPARPRLPDAFPTFAFLFTPADPTVHVEVHEADARWRLPGTAADTDTVLWGRLAWNARPTIDLVPGGDAAGGGDAPGGGLLDGQNGGHARPGHKSFGVHVGIEKLVAVRLEDSHRLDGGQWERRLPAVDHDSAAAAVDCSDDTLAADRIAQRLGEREIRFTVPEQGRPGDDLARTALEQLLRAFGRPHAAANPAGQRACDLAHERQVVAAAHRRIEVDHLHFREMLEPPHPPEHVVVADCEALALYELHDGAILEIDGGNQHWLNHETAIPRNHETVSGSVVSCPHRRTAMPRW